MDEFVCDFDAVKCPAGGEHIWDGPTVVFKSKCASCDGEPPHEGEPFCERCGNDPDYEYVSGEASSCAKCGIDSMTHALMTGP